MFHLIGFARRRQEIIALSSAEAEMNAISRTNRVTHNILAGTVRLSRTAVGARALSTIGHAELRMFTTPDLCPPDPSAKRLVEHPSDAANAGVQHPRFGWSWQPWPPLHHLAAPRLRLDESSRVEVHMLPSAKMSVGILGTYDMRQVAL